MVDSLETWVKSTVSEWINSTNKHRDRKTSGHGSRWADKQVHIPYRYSPQRSLHSSSRPVRLPGPRPGSWPSVFLFELWIRATGQRGSLLRLSEKQRNASQPSALRCRPVAKFAKTYRMALPAGCPPRRHAALLRAAGTMPSRRHMRRSQNLAHSRRSKV